MPTITKSQNTAARAKKYMILTFFLENGLKYAFFGCSDLTFEITSKLIKKWNSNMDHMKQLM